MAKYQQFQITVPVLDGGLNTKNTPPTLPMNESPDLNDVVFDDYGAVGTRNGTLLLNTAAIASASIDMLESYVQNDGTRMLLAGCASGIHALSGTTFAPVTESTGLYTAGVAIHYAQQNNVMFFQNGTQRPYKYNGTEFTNAGNSAPTGTVSLVCGAAGTLTGSYDYAFTAVNSYAAQSDYAVLAASLTVAAGEIILTDIPTWPASSGVNTVNLYRNTAGASGVYWLVTAISNGVSAYTDNNSDSTLVIEAPDDQGQMPTVKYMVSYKERIFCAGNATNPMRLYFSKATEPEVFPSTNYIDVGTGDGLPIKALAVYSNSIVVHKNDGKGQGTIYLLYLPDSTDVSDASNWYLFKAPAAFGAVSHKAQAFFSNLLGYINRYGFYAFSGQDIAASAADSSVGKFLTDSHTFKIEPDVFDINESLIEGCAAIQYKNKIWLAVPKGSTSTANNYVYQYDFVRASSESRQIGAWGRFDSLNINDFTVHDGELYGGSSLEDGFVYKLDTGTSDNGSAIDSYYKTAEISGLPEHRDHTKVWRYVFLTVDTPGNWNMSMNYIVDARNESGTLVSVNLDDQGNDWGSMVWGSDIWGGELTRDRKRIILKNAVSKTIQLKFSTNTADQYWKVHEIQFVYNLRSRR